MSGFLEYDKKHHWCLHRLFETNFICENSSTASKKDYSVIVLSWQVKMDEKIVTTIFITSRSGPVCCASNDDVFKEKIDIQITLQ